MTRNEIILQKKATALNAEEIIKQLEKELLDIKQKK